MVSVFFTGHCLLLTTHHSLLTSYPSPITHRPVRLYLDNPHCLGQFRPNAQHLCEHLHRSCRSLAADPEGKDNPAMSFFQVKGRHESSDILFPFFPLSFS